jgi:hypothetical protein
MIKEHWLFLACMVFALLIGGVQAAIYSSDSAVSVSIRYDNGVPSLTESMMRVATGKTMDGGFEVEAPADPINVITITDNQGNVYSKNIQTPTVSEIYVSSRTVTDTDVMQTTTDPGYPVLEIYWGYAQDPDHPWQYYMRVNNAEDTQAVYSDFAHHTIWTRPITPARTAQIIAGGTVPAWGAV